MIKNFHIHKDVPGFQRGDFGIFLPSDFEKPKKNVEDEFPGLAALAKDASDFAPAPATEKIAKVRPPTSREVLIFDVESLEKQINSKKKNSDFSQQVELFKSAIGNAGRRIVPKINVGKVFEDLEIEFPNFLDAIKGMRQEMAFSAAARPQDFQFRPVVLDGAPAIGKTRFCHTLAKRLGVPLINMSSASLQTSTDLVGSSALWSNSQPGQVFRTLAESDSAVAVLMLDELDKVQENERYSPVSALLQILERESAQHMRDASAASDIDASKLIVIATSNEYNEIDYVLRTRLQKYSIAEPNEAQRITVAQRTFAECSRAIRKKLLLDMASAEALARNQDLTLRDIIAAVRNGIGKALVNGDRVVKVVVAEERDEKPRSIGFLAKF